ncbi:hypothetical protein EG329_013115 [Mollisiaceae sp. DMI_Dod_QoI]|nr:hypothetical protein EG329_013115 [Helotiales sp. DMI_Dod_QoI]
MDSPRFVESESEEEQPYQAQQFSETVKTEPEEQQTYQDQQQSSHLRSAQTSPSNNPLPSSHESACCIAPHHPQFDSDHEIEMNSDSDLSPVNEEFLNDFESEHSPGSKIRSKRKSRHEAPSARPTKRRVISREDVQGEDEDIPDSFNASNYRGKSTSKLATTATTSPKQRGRRGNSFENINHCYEANQNNYLKPSRKNHWSNPATPAYDVQRMLRSDECLAPDNLLKRPDPSFSYIVDGALHPAPHYDWATKSKEDGKKRTTGHPKYQAHLKSNTATRDNLLYYNFLAKDDIRPLAGKLDVGEPLVSEVRDLENILLLFQKKTDLTNTQSQEESFHARPSVNLPIPDHIKAILVDDWENVTKNQQLVPLPAPHSVDSILNDYLAFENPKRQAGSHQADLLLEVVAGLKEYFEKCLGRILLYRFERQQYLEVREGWNSTKGELAGKTVVTTYGAEHFCRLLVSLPELLAQTNMDHQSCNRLCEELTKLTIWLGRNAHTYFRSEYETPGPSYIEKARNG